MPLTPKAVVQLRDSAEECDASLEKELDFFCVLHIDAKPSNVIRGSRNNDCQILLLAERFEPELHHLGTSGQSLSNGAPRSIRQCGARNDNLN
jgi:hypothetical protein